MRGTNFGVGFGIALFFLAGGAALYFGGEELFPSGSAAQDVGGAGSTLRLIGAIWAGVAAFLILLFGLLLLRSKARQRIARTGTPGTATVKKAEQTGTYVNYNPQMKLTMDVAQEGGPAKEVTKRAVVPFTAMGRFGNGTKLPIRIDKNDPDDFEILWDDLPATGGGGGGGKPDTDARLEVLDDLQKKGKIDKAEYEAKRKEILAEL